MLFFSTSMKMSAYYLKVGHSFSDSLCAALPLHDTMRSDLQTVSLRKPQGDTPISNPLSLGSKVIRHEQKC
jgi:hypothetical protein